MTKTFLGLAFFSLMVIVLNACKRVNDQYFPRYHLAPPCGWMNDPNGFCIFGKEYHMFYQHNPNSSLEPGIAHWGHAKSKDLFHWEHLPIAMYPDKTYDKTGLFSGSALIENNTMYLYYTGNVNHPGKTPDREEHQALGVSTDGVHFTKYKNNPVLIGANRQPNIRDPKVWKHGSKYYMVIGNSFKNDTLGRVLLYESNDKTNWQEVAVIGQSNGTLGYMWECPDLFLLNNKFVMLFSPQGVKPQGDRFRNLYQTGYIVGDFNYDTYEFKPITNFIELDNGHDFYATQTIEDDKGRRLLVAWMDMWEQNYPERKDGWTGMLTLIRELVLTNEYRLVQKPIDEVEKIRGHILHSGKTDENGIPLKDKAGEISILAHKSQNLEVIVESVDKSANVSIMYESNTGLVTLDRGGADGIRRTFWKPSGERLKLKIFVDASSIEVFCGNGEVTFSSRFFPKSEVVVRLGRGQTVYNLTVTELKRSILLKKP